MINRARASSAVEALAAEKTEPNDAREAGLRADFKWLITRPAPRDRGHYPREMMSQQRDRYREYVEHPRYGRGPRLTGKNPQGDLSNGIYLGWHSPIGERIADTAIEADTTKQVGRPIQISHYYDVERKCVDCGRMFIFFAEEQKFWYEHLGFPLESDCVRCIDCRKNQQELADMRSKYEKLIQSNVRTENETLELVDCALTLIENDVFGCRTIDRVRCFLNSIPNDSDVRSRGRFRDLLERVKRIARKTG